MLARFLGRARSAAARGASGLNNALHYPAARVRAEAAWVGYRTHARTPTQTHQLPRPRVKWGSGCEWRSPRRKHPQG